MTDEERLDKFEKLISQDVSPFLEKWRKRKQQLNKVNKDMSTDYLDRQRFFWEESFTSEETQKVWILTDGKEILFSSFDEEDIEKPLEEGLELGWVWENDFYPRDFEKTYKLLNT